MKVIITAKAKDDISHDEIEDSYWRELFPSSYTHDLVKHDELNEKSASRKTASRKSSVPLKGVLQQTEDGFVYVKVSNNVIHGLFSLLADNDIEKPPYFDEDGIGAHISVMHESELKDKKDFKDVGKEIGFKLSTMYSVEPKGWEEMERVYFVEVEAPEIEKLRQKYNLPKTYKGLDHNFHITVGVKKAK